MEKKICVVVGAGDFGGLKRKYRREDTIFIAADGGYIYLEYEDVIPDYWIGDSDSLAKNIHINDTCKKIELPVMKDDTDTFSAIKQGLELGCDEFHIYGCLGGRLDHSIANIKLMSDLTGQGKKVYLFGTKDMICAVQNGELSFSDKEKGIISVFSLSEKSEGVTIEGLQYELKNASLTSIDQIGVSNAFVNKHSRISVKNGKLMVMIQNFHELPQRD